MSSEILRSFVSDRFADEHGAKPCTDYGTWRAVYGSVAQPLAALAYRSAADEPLFLETYFDAPIEDIVSRAFGRSVTRKSIVEIGCLAAAPTPALLRLWVDAAAVLSEHHEIAVATLTLPLRAMFARVGMPLISLGTAYSTRLDPGDAAQWGSYYAARPMICAGDIRAGHAALTTFGDDAV
ncbi:MAG: hypothetical protein EON59_15525 [Alphaproteobacteria bacterium]|nr:MAG: hypothetical protein EON59_15525 [Alphaproteobacteria bacterium]